MITESVFHTPRRLHCEIGYILIGWILVASRLERVHPNTRHQFVSPWSYGGWVSNSGVPRSGMPNCEISVVKRLAAILVIARTQMQVCVECRRM